MNNLKKPGLISKIRNTILWGSAMLCVGSPVIAQSQEQEAIGLSSAQQVDLKALTCWDVVTLAEDDRAFAMTLLYGYVLGQTTKSTITPQNIQIAIVSTMTKCADNPDSKVLDILKEQISHSE